MIIDYFYVLYIHTESNGDETILRYPQPQGRIYFSGNRVLKIESKQEYEDFFGRIIMLQQWCGHYIILKNSTIFNIHLDEDFTPEQFIFMIKNPKSLNLFKSFKLIKKFVTL